MSKIFIIAEAGVNHNGDILQAKKLINIACYCGVDAIKFQTFKTDNLLCKKSLKANYQLENSNDKESAYDMLKRLELSKEDHLELFRYCKERGIEYLSSPFDLDSIDELNDLGVETFKIPSGEITNYPYLKKISLLNKKIILSTGMSTLLEIENALKILRENGSSDITLLHCNTEYPTPMKDVNLLAMQTLKNTFNLNVGYSDHTKGIEVSIAAAALGACVIEKHFTLDTSLYGPDHKASLSPTELYNLVQSIRNIELALGNGVKAPTESEIKNINIVRKSIVASRDIKKGEVFTQDNITTKRPGVGISPMRWNEVIGKNATRDYYLDEIIEI